MFNKIDQEISMINFEDVATLIKCSHFSLTWTSRILQAIKEVLNIPMKQFLIGRLGFMSESYKN